MLRSGLLIILLALLSIPTAVAQRITLSPDLTLALGGGIQPRASLGIDETGDETADRLGFGLRRARAQARLLYRNLAGVEYDVEAASGTVQSVDLFIFANVSERVQLRAGYFPMPQPRSFIGTPYPRIDAADRAAIAERWGAGTIGGDGRDMGFDVSYAGQRATVRAALHNGPGTFARTSGNYRESISGSSVVNGVETTGLAASASTVLDLGRGVEAGLFGGFNGAEGERTARLGAGRSYTTGGAHLYWGATPGSQSIRLKLDMLGLRYEEDTAGVVQEAAGASAMGVVRILKTGEAFVRAERFWSDTDSDPDDYLTLGLSYSPSAARGLAYHHARLTLAYSYREGVTSQAHLVVLQGQLAL